MDLLVIAVTKISSAGRTEAAPRSTALGMSTTAPSNMSPAIKTPVGFEFVQPLHDLANKARPEYITHMEVADHGNVPATPCTRQIRQRNVVGGHAELAGIDQSENRDGNRTAVERPCNERALDRDSSEAHQPGDRPTEHGGEGSEIEKSHCNGARVTCNFEDRVVPAQADEKRGQIKRRHGQRDELRRRRVHTREMGQGCRGERRRGEEINDDEDNNQNGEPAQSRLGTKGNSRCGIGKPGPSTQCRKENFTTSSGSADPTER